MIAVIDKVVDSVEAALDGIGNEATIMVGGFGLAGSPTTMLSALAHRKLSGLTIISNNAGHGEEGLAALIASRSVRKVICSFPRFSVPFEELYRRGEIELELTPQGTLSERIRAGGAGIGGFFTPTGAGTALAERKEQRLIDAKVHVFEHPLKADFALLRALVADRAGNLVYNKSARNYNPTMAMAAATTIAEVTRIVEVGELDPEVVVTPGLFVDRVFCLPGAAGVV
jgi:3-oxoadipate CoA-transferase alpha subunit